MTVLKMYTYDNLTDISGTAENLSAQGDAAELIKSFVLCSDATYENGQGTGDPTEIALIVLGNKHNLKKSALNDAYPRLSENPFDSDRKLMSTLTQYGQNNYRVHTKGALDNLLRISTSALVNGKVVPLTDEMKAEYLRVSEDLSDDALRILGVAYKDTAAVIEPDQMEKDLTLIGMVGMIDPPRLEVKDSIQSAIHAGITPIMITGDHKNTAVAIAKDLGIATSLDQSITGSEIDQLSDEAFSEDIKRYRVFARVPRT